MPVVSEAKTEVKKGARYLYSSKFEENQINNDEKYSKNSTN
jgi:hypothetical protein